MYSVHFKRSTIKEIEDLEDSIMNRVIDKLELLKDNPRPEGCRKIKSSQDLWRIRVGEYRIIYQIDDQDQKLTIRSIKHRSKAYE